MTSRRSFPALLGLILLAASPLAGAERTPSAPLSLDDYRALRVQAANRPRRVIFNNDGNEPVYLCKEATAAELLRSRTAALAGSQVDSIFYCTWSSGFSLFTHHTKVGQLFTTREGELFAKNLTQEFHDRGVDPLRVMTDFAHGHGMELIWSFRLNDTHDASTAAYGPLMFRANRLKLEHPEYLIGSRDARPKYGTWSAVDFGRPEIRDLAFRYCEEVCRNYDVDGLELDFFRHLFFFKSSATGQPCSAAELAAMTDLMRRIRAMTEEVGRARHRSLLVAMRVPDSVEYARFVGLDLEQWLTEGLLDLLVVGGYTQLNSWETSVALGHRHGVKVYPSLDESRVRDDAARALRTTNEATRGRVRNVWAAGADGVYFFNRFNPLDPAWRESADPAAVPRLDRDYFVSVRGRGSVPVPHDKFQTLPTLNPHNPITLTAKAVELPLRAAEDFARSDAGRSVTLRLRFSEPVAPATVRLAINDTTLALDSAKADGAWLALPLIDPKILRAANTLSLATTGTPPRKVVLADAMLSVRYAPSR